MCIVTQRNPVIGVINGDKYFQSCHTSRGNTRAGFDSAPLVSVEKGCSSIFKYGPPLSSVGATHTKQLSLILT
jgi:hypothetical protein